MRMKEKVVLITGATGEIGTAMTQRFLAEGASVCITGRSAEKLADISESLGAGAKLTTCLVDALDEAAVLSSVERCVAEFGGIDAIIANAGTEGKVQPLEMYSVEEFNETLLVNVTGVWLYLKHGLLQCVRGEAVVLWQCPRVPAQLVSLACVPTQQVNMR